MQNHELKAATRSLQSKDNIVVDGVAVEEKIIRVIIDEGDDGAKREIDSTASQHGASVDLEGVAGGHEVYQISDDEDKESWF